MPIKIHYSKPYRIKRHKTKGEFDYTKMRADLKSQVPSHVRHSSGIYIYFSSYGTKLFARYVGVNKTGHLVREAMLKKSILKSRLVSDRGRPSVIFLRC